MITFPSIEEIMAIPELKNAYDALQIAANDMFALERKLIESQKKFQKLDDEYIIILNEKFPLH